VTRRRWLPWLAACAALGLAGWLVVRWVEQGAATLLLSGNDAEWIRHSEVPEAVAKWSKNQSRFFRARVDLPTPPEHAPLRVKALRHFSVSVNATPVPPVPAPGPGWLRAQSVDLAPWLRAGTNEVIVRVDNDMGPPMLHAVSAALGIASRGDGSWLVREGDGPWEAATAASPRAPFPISRAFPSVPRSFVSVLPLWLGLVAIGAALSLLSRDRELLRAEHLRWGLLLGFAVLCVHNIDRIPLGLGFDARRHYEYIAYLANEGRIPLATDGWQMFQAPLFYLISAPFYLGLHEVMEQQNVLRALRVLPMLCGLAQIELCFRAGRIAFPERNDLQLLTVSVGGLMPMQLYSSQVVSNEPMAAMWSSWMLVVAFRALASPDRDPLPRTALWLGLLFGLAAISKVSVLALLPLLVAFLAWLTHRRSESVAAFARAASIFGGVSFAIAGWYYLRNWFELGAPFVGGWDPARGLAWWQDPAYRMPGDFWRFGEALVHPIYSSYVGFWDGFYSSVWLDSHLIGAGDLSIAPPWGYAYMLSLALLSLPLSVALAVGTLRAVREPDGATRRLLVFSALALGIVVAAMLAIYLRVPSFSAVKGSYALGLLPCFALLIAWGLEPLLRGRVGPAVVSGFVCAWSAFSYLAFFGAA
jgi:hypothetical protein